MTLFREKPAEGLPETGSCFFKEKSSYSHEQDD